MTTLFDAILKTAECLKGLRYSVSTDAGNVNSLIDTNMNEPDNFFLGGTIFILSGATMGQSSVIKQFTAPTFVFTSQTANHPVGTQYAAMDANYTREALIAAVNAALSALSPYPKIATPATLLTVANQEDYALPAGVYNIKKVFIATNLISPYGYQENRGWFEENGTLHFDMEPPVVGGMKIKLYYECPHSDVDLDTDVITDAIHPDLLAWTAASRALIVRMGVAENSEPNTKSMQPFAQQMANAQKLHPIKHFQKTSRPSGW